MQTREGFWSVYYAGVFGNGMGIIVLDSGMVVGADVTGGIWEGEYQFNSETRQLDIRLTVALPPEILSAVTGQESKVGFREQYQFSLPREMNEEVTHNIQTALGPINAVFKKIRDFP